MKHAECSKTSQMKAIIYFVTAWCMLMAGKPLYTAAQETTSAASDSVRQWIQQHQRPLDTSNYAAFIQSVKPLLDSVAPAQVVGLGEGTHGTSEFQTLRYRITRYLCEEKDFSFVCLENSYGDCAVLNQYLQTGQGNLDSLLQSLLGMWQNAEIKELLQWMRQYNQTHARKLQIGGMDYSSMTTTASLVQAATNKMYAPLHPPMVDTFRSRAAWMDAAYASMNTSRPYAWKEIVDQATKAYTFAKNMRVELSLLGKEVRKRLSRADSAALQTALYNCQLAWHNFWAPANGQQPVSRDEAMANMVRQLSNDAQGAKTIVWAHSAHLAKAQVLEEAGPTTGMYLQEYYPGRYFVLGTGTANGTCSFTKDRFIIPASRFKSGPLQKAIPGSWEQLLMQVSDRPIMIDTKDKQFNLPAMPLRFTGYRSSDKKDFMPASLNQLFDAFLFIPFTQATQVQQ